MAVIGHILRNITILTVDNLSFKEGHILFKQSEHMFGKQKVHQDTDSTEQSTD